MPAIGWTTKDGNNYSFEEALTIARTTGSFEKFPAPALAAMQERRDDGHWLSPSSATYCNRQRILKSQYDYWQDLEASWPAFTGNAYHRELAHASQQHFGIHGTMLEERWRTIDLEVLLPDGTLYPFKMQGTPDLLDIDNGILYDWKSIGEFQYYDAELKQKVNRVFPYPQHELQINLYILMFPEEMVKKAFIWYVKSEGKKGAARRMVEVPIWDREDAYQTACELAVPLAWAEKSGTLPQEKYDSSNWMCRSCPVQALCQQLHKEGK
jgi:hypothetical protein